MSKIKHNEAINILQMILAFIQGIVEMCKKNDNDNDNDNRFALSDE